MKNTTDNSGRLGFRTYYGTTTMGATEAITASLMSSPISASLWSRMCRERLWKERLSPAAAGLWKQRIN